MTDGTLRFLRDLLDGVRRAEAAHPGSVMRPAVSNRHARELLDEVERLRDVVYRALAAGHATPSDPKSDRGECLVLHCELTSRDVEELRKENARLREALGEG